MPEFKIMFMTTCLKRGNDDIMAQKLDSKEVVSLKEISHNNMFQIEVILRLLVKKGVIIQQEYIDEMKQLKKEMAEKGE